MKDRKGFSIIEVLIAMGIMAFVMSLPLLDTVVKANIYYRNLHHAQILARDFTERIRALSYNSPILADDGDVTDLDDINSPDQVMANDTFKGVVFRRFYNIADNVPGVDLKSIRFYVEWRDLTGFHRISYLTIKSPSY